MDTRESGRAVPARRGRPSGGSVLWDSVRRLGKEPEEVRDLLVGKLIQAVEAGEEFALRILADRCLPAGRTLDNAGIFENAKTTEEMSAAVLGALDGGVISPQEATSLNASIQAFGLAGEWREVRDLQRRLIAGGVRNLPPLPSPQPTALPAPVDVDPFS